MDIENCLPRCTFSRSGKKVELRAFIDLHGREEIDKQLASLKFNNAEIENNIQLLVSNDTFFQTKAEGNEAEAVILSQIN